MTCQHNTHKVSPKLLLLDTSLNSHDVLSGYGMALKKKLSKAGFQKAVPGKRKKRKGKPRERGNVGLVCVF